MPGDVLDAGRRDQPIRRLEAGDAAKRRRPDHRARGLGAERDRQHAGGDGSARTGRRASRRMGEIVRIARHRRHHGGEFRGHGLADDDAAGAARQRHRGGVSAWLEAGIDRRAVLGREIGGIENVLEPDRQTAQRRQRQFCIVRGLPRCHQVEHNEGADLLVARRDRLGTDIDDGARRQFAGVDTAGEIERGEHLRHQRSGIRDQDGAEAGSRSRSLMPDP